jgi:hypothetical protein
MSFHFLSICTWKTVHGVLLLYCIFVVRLFLVSVLVTVDLKAIYIESGLLFCSLVF